MQFRRWATERLREYLVKGLYGGRDLGVGNRLTLLDDELLKNLGDIQLRHGLPPYGTLASGDFTVEIETE